jgi:hypothetical protein
MTVMEQAIQIGMTTKRQHVRSSSAATTRAGESARARSAKGCKRTDDGWDDNLLGLVGRRASIGDPAIISGAPAGAHKHILLQSTIHSCAQLRVAEQG